MPNVVRLSVCVKHPSDNIALVDCNGCIFKCSSHPPRNRVPATRRSRGSRRRSRARFSKRAHVVYIAAAVTLHAAEFIAEASVDCRARMIHSATAVVGASQRRVKPKGDGCSSRSGCGRKIRRTRRARAAKRAYVINVAAAITFNVAELVAEASHDSCPRMIHATAAFIRARQRGVKPKRSCGCSGCC